MDLENSAAIYCSNVVEKINAIMDTKKIRQTELVHRMEINQSSLSKLLKGEMRLTLDHLYRFSKALGVPIETLVSDSAAYVTSFEERPVQIHEHALLHSSYLNENILLRDYDHPAFKGYINKEFNVYLFSTITTESYLLNGKLSFTPSATGHFCKATFLLNTGKYDSENKSITKTYNGEMLISLGMGVIYVFLINSDNGDICFITFKHLYLFNQDLECRVATVASTSSGGNRLPISQRMLISEKELDVNREDSIDNSFVRGQLRMSNSEILISENVMNELLDKYYTEESESEKKSIYNFLKQITDKSRSDSGSGISSFPKECFYHIEEANLKNVSVSSQVKAKGIGILRDASTSRRYNKVSTKTDEFVYDYICNRFECKK